MEVAMQIMNGNEQIKTDTSKFHTGKQIEVTARTDQSKHTTLENTR